LGGPLSKLCPSAPFCIQDGRHSSCLHSSNLDNFWLKIEQFWPFEEISIFSNGGHLGYRTALTDTILKGVSFLTCITGFFMNFELLPILTDYANLKKGGMKFKKNLL
jgi:hypothetical protein